MRSICKMGVGIIIVTERVGVLAVVQQPIIPVMVVESVMRRETGVITAMLLEMAALGELRMVVTMLLDGQIVSYPLVVLVTANHFTQSA